MGTTVYTVQIALPSAEAMKQFYSLMHAAEAAEDRWSRETGTEMLERMFKGDLNDDECSFFSACWNILINTGDFARLLCAYTTMEATFQDPGVGHVAFKPSLVQQIQDAKLVPVLIEAYGEALTDRDTWQAAALAGRDEWLAQEDRAELAEQSSKELEESLGIANAATQLWKERAKAAEQLLQQPIPALGSVEVNDAAWKLHDLLTEHGPLNGHQFNNLKGCFYEAVKTCFKVEEE
ncbi:hypothetical protein [Serratia fonticola]|uniref:hypothetical protein n=1 Tax=Serratia fonticola TaxID=47917 RepID=UPI001FCEA12C|nr:hypothetical protein [Serratia fonticola]